MSLVNPRLSVSSVNATLTQNSRVRIPDFLTQDFALNLYHSMLHATPWELAYFDQIEQRPQKLSPAEYQRTKQNWNSFLAERVYPKQANLKQANPNQDSYAFIYESYMVVTAYLEGRDRGHPLHGFLEFLNHPATLELFRKLTGEDAIRKIDAQATLYRGGHFLKKHNDADSGTGRLFAYVLNLSPNWSADNGGLLHFVEEGAVTETFIPAFNTLNIFRVPQDHFVSPVAPFCADGRYSITGWMYSK